MKVYVAGAWVEQHKRARPMIARLRAIGVEITFDWTVPEIDKCSCGCRRDSHAPIAPIRDQVGEWRAATSTRCEKCGVCGEFNGIGVTTDSALSNEDRAKFARLDLDGVLDADVLLLLAANDKGACGSWVELGAALALRDERADSPIHTAKPHIIVAGPKARRTIFTELADMLFDTDEEAFEQLAAMAPSMVAVMWGSRAMRAGKCPPGYPCLACQRLGEHLEPVEGA